MLGEPAEGSSVARRPSSSPLGAGTGLRGAEPRCGENGQVERVCFARRMENGEWRMKTEE